MTCPTEIPRVPIGIGVGNAWPVTFVTGASGLDMTTVTSASFDVIRKSDGSHSVWTGAVQSGATTDQCVVKVSFTGAEITVLGLYEIAPSLIVAGNPVPAGSLLLLAVDPHQL